MSLIRSLLCLSLLTVSLHAETETAAPASQNQVAAVQTEADQEANPDIQWFKEYGMVTLSVHKQEPGIYKIEVRYTNLSNETVSARFVSLSFPLSEKSSAEQPTIEIPRRGSTLFPETWIRLAKYRLGDEHYEAETEIFPLDAWDPAKVTVQNFPIEEEDIVQWLKLQSYINLSAQMELTKGDHAPVMVTYEVEKYLKPQINWADGKSAD